jgi:acetylornithine deacetylase/succinyl-diaminopimelate desuccinylase-like protein
VAVASTNGPWPVTGAARNARHRALCHALEQRRRAVEQLKALVRFATVSADPRRQGELRRCANRLAAQLRRIGLDDVRVEGRRHPIVWGQWRNTPGRPTLLIYGHYDVQPVDPIAEWRSPPFHAVLRGGRLFGRGASDDKGQLLAHLRALEAYLATSGHLPVNVVCVLEGQEEIGSPDLPGFLRRHRHELRADAAVISDTRMPAPDRPALIHGLRGSLACELTVMTGARQLHAGHFGGAVHGAPQALAELLAGLHHPDGRVAIPGFYRHVRPLPRTERLRAARRAPTDQQLRREAGIGRDWGDPRFTAHERTTIRPAVIVTGIQGGHAGPGFQSAIPNRASSRLNLRLVPGQDPTEIERLLRRHLARSAPPGVRLQLTTSGGARPVSIDPTHPALAAAMRAYRLGFGVQPILLRSGGTIPVVDLLKRELGLTTVLMGFALPEDHIHAPNESFHLDNFFRGIATSIHFLSECARSPGRPTPRRAPPGDGWSDGRDAWLGPAYRYDRSG